MESWTGRLRRLLFGGASSSSAGGESGEPAEPGERLDAAQRRLKATIDSPADDGAGSG